jgi:hypothetical protein
MEAIDLPLYELAVVEGIGQGGHALAEGEDMHREVVGFDREPEFLELSPKPRPEQIEDTDSLRARGLIEFGKFVREGSDRTAVVRCPHGW